MKKNVSIKLNDDVDHEDANGCYRGIQIDIRYPKAKAVSCNGDCIWGDTHNKVVKVSKISLFLTCQVSEDEDDSPIFMYDPSDTMCYVRVSSRTSWQIYTDEGFEKGISKLVAQALGIPKIDVMFTEQGMQEDGNHSMELDNIGDARICQWLLKQKVKGVPVLEKKEVVFFGAKKR